MNLNFDHFKKKKNRKKELKRHIIPVAGIYPAELNGKHQEGEKKEYQGRIFSK